MNWVWGFWRRGLWSLGISTSRSEIWRDGKRRIWGENVKGGNLEDRWDYFIVCEVDLRRSLGFRNREQWVKWAIYRMEVGFRKSATSIFLITVVNANWMSLFMLKTNVNEHQTSSVLTKPTLTKSIYLQKYHRA